MAGKLRPCTPRLCRATGAERGKTDSTSPPVSPNLLPIFSSFFSFFPHFQLFFTSLSLVLSTPIRLPSFYSDRPEIIDVKGLGCVRIHPENSHQSDQSQWCFTSVFFGDLIPKPLPHSLWNISRTTSMFQSFSTYRKVHGLKTTSKHPYTTCSYFSSYLYNVQLFASSLLLSPFQFFRQDRVIAS